MSVFETVNAVLSSAVSIVNEYIWYLAFIMLGCMGVYFTLKTKGVQLGMLKESCRLSFTGMTKSDILGGKNAVSSFQAFCVSMGARVGVGNISGVGMALIMGGPGAIFWMWLFALIGAATSFVECTIGQIYKERGNDGLFHGGPAYYIKNALGKGKFAIFVAILIIITYPICFTQVQANTITDAFVTAFTVDPWIMAIIVTVISAIVIFGGITRVARVSSWVVPIMALVYMIIAIVIIAMNFTRIPEMFSLIFSCAFGLQQFGGAALGTAIIWGVKRGAFSNEAGIGSVPNVVSAAKVKHPARQGLMQSLGVLIDTLVVCSATAFMVLLVGDYTKYVAAAGGPDMISGVTLVQNMLTQDSILGAAAPYIIALFILVFAFSSMISYYSMGEANAKFITKSKKAVWAFRFIVIIMIFLACIAKFDLVWAMADIFMAIMCLVNLGVLIFIGKHAFEALVDYKKQRASGVKEPVFDPSVLSSQKGITCWPDKDE
ncbi:MAG: alanine/glycine:cation symporter family protein [Methanocorpusculum sp.]|nr:alanine/glycine:cation symporter family protein [Methanocorpusculum sp.]